MGVLNLPSSPMLKPPPPPSSPQAPILKWISILLPSLRAELLILVAAAVAHLQWQPHR